MSAFNDWIRESWGYAPELMDNMVQAFQAGRAYQRDVDASYVLSLWGGRYTCVEVTTVAKAIREQKIDE